MKITDNLNPKQLEAVQTLEGPLLILAGAGSGKTRVLTHRIAYLMYEKNVYPNNILAITFTNKAAKEMRERLEKLIKQSVDNLWVSTFHSACVRILRREIEVLGYTSNFVIYDNADQQTLIKMILKDMNLDEKKYTPRSIITQISSYKNELKSPTSAKKTAENYYDEVTCDIYEKYQTRLKENNAVDFDDIIMLVVLLFQKDKEILQKYQERFKYILVDEYQDTNTCQYMLIKLLAEKHHNLCVVGDDDQSIYGWRGADIRNILNFENDYQNTKIIKLEQNYRSTQTILDAANGVISNNSDRKSKSLWTDQSGGDKVYLHTAHDELSEANFISRKIREMSKENSLGFNSFAVLCRTTVQFRAIEDGLIRNQIPYRIIGGTKFYDRKEIKDVLAYLKILVNPADEISLKRVINTPKRGIGDTTWDHLKRHATNKNITVFEALNTPEEAGVSSRATNPIKNFKKIMDEFIILSKKTDITNLTNTILADTGYIEELEAEKTIEAATRVENIKEFLSVTLDYDTKNPGGDLETFTAEISLFTDIDNYDQNEEAISVMTIHAAKGLEFPTVFIAGLEEGIFPHIRSINSGNNTELEEERRLCYVAITRAREKLFLTNAWSRMIFGRSTSNAKSRFLDELPLELIESEARIKTKATFTKNVETQIVTKTCNSSYDVGGKVEHQKWGIGVIVSVKGSGEDAELNVAFPDLGIKKLIAKYAPISII
ncbi:ATP-dependent DNA helicase PcrA [Desulfonispora thiosulfatigenes DSM 11270]|uniref:ATP-dependent DNA helicase n=1 Tax=Desulfonispora thiosulfatigenes DSM 11270 TaxID=656914 RepID=A0A1W1UGE6_DESTI|nr:DNA helicase PcrA [Desulfonispora thiosulfatigenes]SMB80175.1 ATP-dependent DNA helicase PcrA [Desulfonispora thiosulfatigenes DSM 11270]